MNAKKVSLVYYTKHHVSVGHWIRHVGLDYLPTCGHLSTSVGYCKDLCAHTSHIPTYVYSTNTHMYLIPTCTSQDGSKVGTYVVALSLPTKYQFFFVISLSWYRFTLTGLLQKAVVKHQVSLWHTQTYTMYTASNQPCFNWSLRACSGSVMMYM